MTKHSTTTGPPSSTSTRSSCFLGCFGCSGEKTQPEDEVNSGSRRHRRVSKWRFSFKKSPAKTVPVDVTTVPRKSKPVNDAPATSDTPSTKKHVVMVEGKHDPVTTDEKKARRKKQTVVVRSLDESCIKETKLVATSAKGQGLASTEGKTESKSISSAERIKSLHEAPPTDGDGDRSPPLSIEDFDFIIGMSIIIVILVIMVLWGKLCAILCTSAWFFIVPRLIAVKEHSVVDTADDKLPGNNMDLESTEYKKRVILEGLLRRNHRNVVGRL